MKAVQFGAMIAAMSGIFGVVSCKSAPRGFHEDPLADCKLGLSNRTCSNQIEDFGGAVWFAQFGNKVQTESSSDRFERVRLSLKNQNKELRFTFEIIRAKGGKTTFERLKGRAAFHPRDNPGQFIPLETSKSTQSQNEFTFYTDTVTPSGTLDWSVDESSCKKTKKSATTLKVERNGHTLTLYTGPDRRVNRDAFAVIALLPFYALAETVKFIGASQFERIYSDMPFPGSEDIWNKYQGESVGCLEP